VLGPSHHGSSGNPVPGTSNILQMSTADPVSVSVSSATMNAVDDGIEVRLVDAEIVIAETYFSSL